MTKFTAATCHGQNRNPRAGAGRALELLTGTALPEVWQDTVTRKHTDAPGVTPRGDPVRRGRHPRGPPRGAAEAEAARRKGKRVAGSGAVVAGAMRTRRGTVLRPPPQPGRADDGAEEPAGGGRAGPEELADELEESHERQFRAVMAALDSGEEAGDSEEEEEEEEVLGLQLPEDSSEEEDGLGEEEEEEEEEEVDGLDSYVDHSAEEVGDEEDEDGDEEDEDGEGEKERDEMEAEDGDLSMDSDLEERPQDAGLPHELSWGQRKQLYYDTDYGSDARAKGGRSQQEVDAEEQEEEQEAQVIQRRLVRDLGEDDYGLDMIQGYLAEQRKTQDSKGQKIDKDLQALSRKEQLKLLKQESPELLQLIEDLEVKLMELKDELHPLLQMVKNGTIPQGKGSRYLQTKYHLYLNYCANISFYLVLKSKRMPVHSHPVIERLVAYRNIINDLAVVDQRLSSQVRMLLKNYYDKKEQKLPKEKKFAMFLPLDAKKNKPKGAPALANGRADELSGESDLDEEAALKYYRMMEEKLRVKRKRTGDQDALEEAAAMEEEDPNKKRGVTYQMIKNKGLTPRRKKIDRNPRVKHREKFRRAKIRRKGQVREVRRELHRYAGELSGIRAGVKKSRKLQ
ncbi:something about silencing protein 10 [Columba livia]|uniref:something about silencing protein 10 n=1 Tax=Columba livia TaxID=8932 RepID=UPI0031BAD1C6